MSTIPQTGQDRQPQEPPEGPGDQAQQSHKPQRVRGIVAATVGNALEWFDMGIYALLAIYIGKNFFPANNPSIELIQTFAVFGISFLIRPLGGLILGSYADRKGMKKALTLTIRLMFIGTAMNAFMPGYDTIGMLAPLGIIFARLIQGFSAGGEFGAATTYLLAQNSKRRGLLGSFQFASQGLGGLCAALCVALLTSVLSTSEMTAWGWRIPFFIGMLIGPAGYYIRKHVAEAPIARVEEPVKDSPIVDVFKTQKLGIFVAGGSLAISTALNFIMQYMPTFGIKNLGLDPSASFSSLVIASTILTFGTPLVGYLSDKIGRLRIMVPTVITTAILVIPLFFWLINSRSFFVLVLVMIILACLKTAYFGALPSVMADSFSPRSRSTGLSFSYNSSVALFGGFTPLVATYLIQSTGQPVAPGYYLAFLACFSLLALWAGFKFKAIR